MSTQSWFARARGRLFHTYFLIRRPMTLGVRAMIFSEDGQSVFLVRHTYVPGWYLPGGGVERGETLREALVKELREECNIELTGAAQLFEIYFNTRISRRDHVALYVVRAFRQTAPKAPDREIAEAGFFRLDALPEGTRDSTRLRIADVKEGRAGDGRW